jgi:hypothetical protein
MAKLDFSSWVQLACAVVQTAMAFVSLAAAWWFAHSEKQRADSAAVERDVSFLESVLSIGNEALGHIGEARRQANPEFVDFRDTMLELHDALQPIRQTGPADASVLVLVARLSAALKIGPRLPTGPDPWLTTLNEAETAIRAQLSSLDDHLGYLVKTARFKLRPRS